MNFSGTTTQHCSIFVRPVTASKVCVADCLSIGSPLIIGRLFFTMISSSIVDEEGVVNFATIILRNDNPNLSEIIAEFTESIQLLSQKPE